MQPWPLPHAPIPQGVDTQESVERFSWYLLDLLLLQTPLSKGTNGVPLDEVSGVQQVAINCLQKLLVDELDRAVQMLFHNFAQRNLPPNSTAQ